MKRAVSLVAVSVFCYVLSACGFHGPAPAPPTDLAGAAVTAANTAQTTPTQPVIAASTVASLPVATSTPTRTPEPGPVRTRTEAPPTPLATLEAELRRKMDEIAMEVEELRGLAATESMARALMTRDELADYVQREFVEDYPPSEVEADVRVLAAFDFVPEDYDLRGLLLELYSTQILGLYDDELDTMFVVTESEEESKPELDLMARITFAHEYTHALQDENFGLDGFLDEDLLNDDEVLARLSLVEGDATLAMTEYFVAELDETPDEEIEALREAAGQDEAFLLEEVPPIIRETFDFPYTYGLAFVSALQEEGWFAVDAAFADPPTSSEQILHPEKYRTRDVPQVVTLPPLTDTLGAGWSLVEAETLGEFQTRLYLELQVDREAATTAAEGWDGDQYAVFVRDDDEVLVFRTVWDSTQDAKEFAAAYRQYAEGRYSQPPSRAARGVLWWEVPEQATALEGRESTVTVVVGPERRVIERILDRLAQASPGGSRAPRAPEPEDPMGVDQWNG